VKVSKSDLDMSGTRLGSHTIVRLIGKGGIGTVYLARNEKNAALEALKILSPDLVGSRRTEERFEREIANSRVLNHPNIVKVIDYGKSRDIWYFTMEYCKGGSLNDFLLRERMPSTAEACRIIMQVLDGLHYAHNAEIPQIKMTDGTFSKGIGLIHRDIKPENILIKNKPEIRRQMTDDPASSGNYAVAGSGQKADDLIIKISDFGLAKNFSFAGKTGYTQTGSVGGSLDFISRQQLINYKYSKPEVDVWSAAAVLYFLLTARPPRDCKTEKNPFNAILKNNPIPLLNVEPSVPQELTSIIDKALDDSGSLFYKKAIDLKTDIGQFLEKCKQEG